MLSRRPDTFLPLGHARGHPNPWVACIGLAHETNGRAPDSKGMLPEGFHCVRGRPGLAGHTVGHAAAKGGIPEHGFPWEQSGMDW